MHGFNALGMQLTIELDAHLDTAVLARPGKNQHWRQLTTARQTLASDCARCSAAPLTFDHERPRNGGNGDLAMRYADDRVCCALS